MQGLMKRKPLESAKPLWKLKNQREHFHSTINRSKSNLIVHSSCQKRKFTNSNWSDNLQEENNPEEYFIYLRKQIQPITNRS